MVAEPSKSEWACLACTFFNTNAGAEICEMCGTPRGFGGAAAGDQEDGGGGGDGGKGEGGGGGGGKAKGEGGAGDGAHLATDFTGASLVGKRVIAHGLSREDVNGRRGVVLSYDPAADRYTVQLAHGKAGKAMKVKLKPRNLIIDLTGKRVMAHGLSREDINGRHGVVLGFDLSAERYAVQLEPDAAKFKLKPVGRGQHTTSTRRDHRHPSPPAATRRHPITSFDHSLAHLSLSPPHTSHTPHTTHTTSTPRPTS